MENATRVAIPLSDKFEYTVWVDGTEITDFYVNFDTAVHIALTNREDGYENITIEYIPLSEQG